jgi:hypothetical protein
MTVQGRDPAALVWLVAAGVALAVNGVAMREGMAIWAARSAAMAAVPPEARLTAPPRILAGQAQPTPTVAPTSQTLAPAGAQAARLAPVARDTAAAVTGAERLGARAQPADRLAATAQPAPAVAATIVPPDAPRAQAVPLTPATAPRVGGTAPVATPLPQSPGLRPDRPGAQVVGAVTPGLAAPLPAAEPSRPASVAPVTAAPVASGPVAVARVSGATVAATVPDRPAALAALAPVAAPERIAAATPPPPEPRPDQAGVAAPDAGAAPPETTYRDVLDLIAETPVPPCFAALPTLSDTGDFQLEVFARTETDLADFAARLRERLGQVPNATLKPVSAAQCAALEALRAAPAFPAFTIYFDLAARDITSGSALEGRVGNTGGGVLTLLVIDDEGTVQDLATFLRFAAGEARFSVPLTLTAGPVETRQLLMALSTPAVPRTVIDLNGAKADAYFPALTAELRARGMREDVAMVAFSVR